MRQCIYRVYKIKENSGCLVIPSIIITMLNLYSFDFVSPNLLAEVFVPIIHYLSLM